MNTRLINQGLVVGALQSALLLSINAWAVDDPANRTVYGSGYAMRTACGKEINRWYGNSFITQCDQIWGTQTTGASRNNALYNQAPQQVSAQGTQATRLTAAQLGQMQGAIDSRMNTLFARLTPAAQNSMLADTSRLGMIGGAASADNPADSMNLGPIGVWFNSSYNTGAISTNDQQLGYDFGNWGFTMGADYKPIERLAIGTAFAFGRNQANFASNLGNTENDAYTGMIYAAWYPVDNLHIDANASYGGNDYSTQRNISYQLDNPDMWNVNTVVRGATGGDHYSFGLRSGYNLSIDSLTIEPYARFNYYSLGVDSYKEQGLSGFELSMGKQNIDSLITSLGTQLSYAFSYSWGVLLPQLYAEWHHQFKDSQRYSSASYVGDLSNQQFGIFTTEPTRNFATVGTRLGSSFGHGLSGFLSYDAILGYQDVNSQRIMLGGRFEF